MIINPLVSAIIYTAALLLSFYFLNWLKTFLKRPGLKEILSFSNLISCLTIVSILFAIFTYWDYQDFLRENKTIIFDNARTEIGGNFSFLEILEKEGAVLVEKEEVYFRRYQFSFSDELPGVAENKTVRESSIAVVNNMKQVNNALDSMVVLALTPVNDMNLEITRQNLMKKSMKDIQNLNILIREQLNFLNGAEIK